MRLLGAGGGRRRELPTRGLIILNKLMEVTEAASEMHDPHQDHRDNEVMTQLDNTTRGPTLQRR